MVDDVDDDDDNMKCRVVCDVDKQNNFPGCFIYKSILADTANDLFCFRLMKIR